MQSDYPFAFLLSHRMMPHPTEQKSGLLSFGPRHPAQGLVSASACLQMLQSSPHGAIISAENILLILLICPGRLIGNT
jgi:hypothetical protein